MIYSQPPSFPGGSCEDSLQVRAQGKLQDVPVYVRQMCHICMLCKLGYVVHSRVCSPIMLSQTWQEVIPRGEMASLHRRRTVEQTLPSSQ